MQAVLHWLNADADKPTVKDFCAMIINLDGSIERLEDTLVLFPINCPFHAIGSGRDFAISAMSMGKTAKEGVELAAQWDLWTGGPIIELQLEWRRID